MGDNGHHEALGLEEYVTRVAADITRTVEHQRRVLAKYVNRWQLDGQNIDYCPLIDCSPMQKYRSALLDAIQVLEETRRSFKSRQLEELRKRLETLLAEDAARNL